MTEAEARQPLIVERNGRRVAIVAASTGTAGSSPPAANSAGSNRLPPSVLAGDVRQAATQADIVLVLLHRDGEGSAAPDSELTAAAHLAIGAGAGAVIVSNPGGIGGLAVYKERPILFGTGAVTSNPAAVELRQSAIVDMVFAGNRLIRLRLHGIESGPSGRPRLMAGDEQAALLDRFWRLSTMLADQSR
jgi:poly-gamma-glutamate capsule biosynthesis protein CapA/YwtB (metallophosphatase superfamily)